MSDKVIWYGGSRLYVSVEGAGGRVDPSLPWYRYVALPDATRFPTALAAQLMIPKWAEDEWMVQSEEEALAIHAMMEILDE